MARRVMMVRTCGQGRVGQIVTLLADAAAELVAGGMARYIDEPAAETMMEEPERNAMKPKPRKRRKRTTRSSPAGAGHEVGTKGTKDGEEKADS